MASNTADLSDVCVKLYSFRDREYIHVIFRNELQELIGGPFVELYKNKNRLYFVGYEYNNTGLFKMKEGKVVQIQAKQAVSDYKRFVGDYSLEYDNTENKYYIDIENKQNQPVSVKTKKTTGEPKATIEEPKITENESNNREIIESNGGIVSQLYKLLKVNIKKQPETVRALLTAIDTLGIDNNTNTKSLFSVLEKEIPDTEVDAKAIIRVMQLVSE